MAEHLTINWPDMAARAAYMAAAAACGVLDSDADADEWPWLSGPMGLDGEGNDLTRAGVQTLLFRFALDNPGAPAEALFRFAAARGLHCLDGDDWPALERHFRVAYEVFAHLAPILHKRFGELAAIEWAEEHYPSSGSPPLAAALTDVPIEDTILAPHPDPLATNPNMVLVIQQSGAAAAMAADDSSEGGANGEDRDGAIAAEALAAGAAWPTDTPAERAPKATVVDESAPAPAAPAPSTETAA